MDRRKITMSGLLCVFLCFGLPWRVVDSTKWVDDIMKNIVEESEFKLVKLMTRLDDDEILENQVIEEIFIKLMERLPTSKINFDENFALSENSIPDGTTGALIDTSATLFLMVIEDRDGLSIRMAENFIDTVAEMATNHYSPKYLMLFTSHFKASEHIEELLTYAWSKNQMLDFTILELATIPRYKNTSTCSSVTLPTIHRLNPFKKEYSSEKWTRGRNNLFPNELTDMSGYPLQVYGDRGGFVSLTGTLVVKMFAEKFNCSIKYHEILEYDILFGNRSALFDDAELHNSDLIAFELPINSPSWKNMQPTVPVLMDELCILVPILMSKEITSIVNHLIWACILSFGIILFFWIFMRLLQFRNYPWRIFNIGRVLFGVSIQQQPRGNVERIMFMCLLAIFAGYSSTIYAGIIDITWSKEQIEVPFESFEDLDRSGLTLYITNSDFVRLADVLEGPLSAMKNRIVKIDDPVHHAMLLAERRNYSSLISKSFGESIILGTLDDNGRALLKFAKPCLWNEPYAFPIRKRSPYRASFDKLIGRMQSSGFFEKQKSDILENFYAGADFIPEPEEDVDHLTPQLLILLFVGYSLSILVFFCEIIYHRLSVYINSKKRPRPPPFPFVL